MTRDEVTPLDCEISIPCDQCSFADQCYADRKENSDG